MSETPQKPSVSRHPMTVSVQQRWIAPAALAIALVAIALAGWGLVSGPKVESPAFTSDDVADARTRACSAYLVVRNAVAVQTHTDLGSEPVAIGTVAANSRLAMSAGGSYLRDRVDQATPVDIAEAVRAFADALQDISIYAQSGVGAEDPAQADRLRAGEATSNRVAELCK